MASGPATAAGFRSEPATLFLTAASITALAVAQPLLDLLGRTPEFFTARGAPTSDVVLLGVLLGLVVPVLVGGLVLAVHRLSPGAGRLVHAVVIVVSGALLMLAVLAHTPAARWPAWALFASAVVAGTGLAMAYRRSTATREVLRYAAVTPAAVVVLFLVVAPTSRLVWGSASEAMAAGPLADPAPVVMVVFDEFPAATLIDGSGEIRADQFPGFARLAADATWFRNAVGVHERTEEALPTMLTGTLAPLDENVPSAADYPDNLFTLVGDAYRVEAVESVTALCPSAVCVDGSRPRLSFATRWRSLGNDLAVVAGHIFLPDDVAAGLPPIDHGWVDFAAAATPRAWDLNRRFNDAVDADRRVGIAAFLDGLDRPLADGEMHFAHILLPHSPWDILPDGRGYAAPRVPPGEWAVWTDDAWLVEQAYQRHLLQVQYVDRFIDGLLDRLEASGSYEETLLVVTADHGVAIRPGIDRRVITEDNVGDVAAVPLFIKRPGEANGPVSDYRAESIDILPTIAGLLGVEVPWRTSGVDLFAADLPDRASSTMLSSEGSVTFAADGAAKVAVARYHESWFPEGDPFQLAPPGQHDLLGADVASFDSNEGPEAEMTLDQRYPMTDPGAGLVPAVVSGVITGIPAENRVVAIAVDGRVVAVTRTWVRGGAVEFQAMLPPEAFESPTAPSLYLVDGSGSDRTLTPIGG